MVARASVRRRFAHRGRMARLRLPLSWPPGTPRAIALARQAHY